MKRTLSQIWKDLSHGKQIIDYALILVAFVLPVLKLLGLVSTEQVIWATLPALGLLIAKAVSNTWREAGDVRIHENWSGEVHEALAKAKESIVILTSWVVDAPTVADKISVACRRINRKLKVDIYMLDPRQPFGAQRYGEVYDSKNVTGAGWLSNYRNHFETSRAQISNRLKSANVDLKFHIYRTMPNVKICVVDKERFFFSWLPADDASTKNVCFELSKKSTNEDVQYAIDKVWEHLDALTMKSADADELDV
jgi:hypothetical protein